MVSSTVHGVLTLIFRVLRLLIKNSMDYLLRKASRVSRQRVTSNYSALKISKKLESDFKHKIKKVIFTFPEILNNLVPVLRSRPNQANHSGPRRQIVGATAMVSTLLTVVGQPKSYTVLVSELGGLRTYRLDVYLNFFIMNLIQSNLQILTFEV